MSKTKKKAAPAKAVKKATKPAHNKAVPRALASKHTAAATIFVYKTADGDRVRTSPQRLSTGRGVIEWTVVNLVSDDPVDVTISWPKGSPWGGFAPISFKDGNIRVPVAGAKDGLYKYSVTANGCTEDPEVEIPGN